jgi:hypothetical protein
MNKPSTKFYADVESLIESVLSKEQEELVKKIVKTDLILKKHWENDFEKIRKETLAQHCFDLFECLEMMLVNIDKAAEVQKHLKSHN